jgi:putative spermidine/putrescine transport system substrate-binding protein
MPMSRHRTGPGLALFAVCLVGFHLPAPPAHAEDTVSIAGDGGVYQDAERKAFYEPAAQKLGIKVKDYSGTGIAPLRAQVKSGAVTWDVVELWNGLCEQAGREGLTEKLDYSVIDRSGIPEGLSGDNWIAITSYSAVLVYNSKKYGANPPKTWADFFDVGKFPGRRSLNPGDTSVEIALLADGVAPDKLYPMDLDRAFKKLAQIKPNISAWWTSGAQAMQFARDQEVDMLSMWNGRADAAIKDGAPVTYTYNQGVVEMDCLVVAKGAPHKDLAMKVVGAIVSPDIQANLPKFINYAPVNQKAFEAGRISKEVADKLSTSPQNIHQQVVLNIKWWSDHAQEVQQRFDQLMH